MFFRVIFAAIIGGLLAFGGGAISHEVLKLTGRHLVAPGDMTSAKEMISKNFIKPGIYVFPMMPAMDGKLGENEQKAALDKFNEEYKSGPGAFVSVMPVGEDFDWKRIFGAEIVTNIIAAFLAALVVAMSRPNLGFIVRWFIVMLIAVFSWVSVNASYHIWYRFPLPWVQDELYCALIEWAIAGIAIAAIVKPRERQYGY